MKRQGVEEEDRGAASSGRYRNLESSDQEITTGLLTQSDDAHVTLADACDIAYVALKPCSFS